MLHQPEVTLSCKLRETRKLQGTVPYSTKNKFGFQTHLPWSDRRVIVAQTSQVDINETLQPNNHLLNWHKKTRRVTLTNQLG